LLADFARRLGKWQAGCKAAKRFPATRCRLLERRDSRSRESDTGLTTSSDFFAPVAAGIFEQNQLRCRKK